MRVPYHRIAPLQDYAQIFSGKPIYLPLLTIAVRHQRKREAFLAVPGLAADQSERGTATQRTFEELAPAFSIRLRRTGK